MFHSTKRTFIGALLVAGTSIGGGMLGLPVATAVGGFYPSLFFLLLSWGFMTSTGLILAEVCCRHGGRPNLVTLADEGLGNTGKIFAWILSVFLFSALIIAYLVGLSGLISRLIGIEPNAQMISLVALCAGIALWPRFQLLLRLNTFLMVLLGGSYALFIMVGAPYVQSALLDRADWSQAPFALPVLFTSFGFQGTVPSLAAIMGYDKARIRRAIVIGTTLTLMVYIVWQWVLLGVVPYTGGLEVAIQQGLDAVAPLSSQVQSPSLFIVGECFAFAAISTSLLGVGLGLMDFLSDGLKLQLNRASHSVILLLLILVPTTLIAMCNPHIFLTALGLAGGIGCALLLGLFPILIAASKKELFGIYRSKIVLGALLAFLFFELLIEVYHLV